MCRQHLLFFIHLLIYSGYSGNQIENLNYFIPDQSIKHSIKLKAANYSPWRSESLAYFKWIGANSPTNLSYRLKSDRSHLPLNRDANSSHSSDNPYRNFPTSSDRGPLIIWSIMAGNADQFHLFSSPGLQLTKDSPYHHEMGSLFKNSWRLLHYRPLQPLNLRPPSMACSFADPGGLTLRQSWVTGVKPIGTI